MPSRFSARSCASRRRDVASGVKGFKLQRFKGLKEVLGVLGAWSSR